MKKKIVIINANKFIKFMKLDKVLHFGSTPDSINKTSTAWNTNKKQKIKYIYLSSYSSI